MNAMKHFCQRKISRVVLWASVFVLLLGDVTARIVDPRLTLPPSTAQVSDIIMAKGVFEPDLADVKSKALVDAINQLKAIAHCRPPRIMFKALVAVSHNNPSFGISLAEARKEALQQWLSSNKANPLEPDQYDTNTGVTSELTPQESYDTGLVQLNFSKFNDQDQDPPQIKLTAKPDPGTCVRSGAQIQVTIQASERYEDGHKSWPSGVQMIQLKANGNVVEPTGFWRTPQPCDRQTLTVSYKVPSPAPSVVHLEAIVDDAANPTHENSKSVDFPTGTECKNVMPSNCKSKGYARVGMLDGSPALGSFDPASPNYNIVSCNFRWSICGKGFIKTKLVKNAPGACDAFFNSEKASLTKEQFCCDCYPKCKK